MLKRFENILIEPAGGKAWPSGPVWPAAEEGGEPGLHRQWVNGHPDPKQPAASGRTPVVVEEPCIWAGAASIHFGHFMAEHSQRLLFSRLAMPEARLVITVARRKGAREVPGYVFDLCDWLEIPRDRLLFVKDRPLLARELYVMPQGEQLEKVNLGLSVVKHRWCGPMPEYIEALNALQAKKGIVLATGGTLYVSRSRLAPDMVRIPGEAYLEDRLAALGVTVIWPETMSFDAQMTAYAKAERIIFAEGSAVHARQHLGHLPQDVAILVRRKRVRLAQEHMEPRVRKLAHIDPVECNILFSEGPTGGTGRQGSMPVYDQDRLLDLFAEFGIDLAPVWDRAEYRKAHDRDLDEWLLANLAGATTSVERAAGLARMKASLIGSGLVEQFVRLNQVAARWKKDQREAAPSAGAPP
ncbi:glycosyltransferase 61 family protein [Mangrovicoccus ximenensis]|uniref:glycosyltransferase 61 family protein n=1 Tax=Mangrovicoccus ximenensis TaxID=1911570 RepID=UPI000D3DA698|nr:glycosyltransferase 61 family protein [Mangrovicoccus ximenensis]